MGLYLKIWSKISFLNLFLWICIYIYSCVSRHLRSLTTANWVSFDFNVSYSSSWGYPLINTLKLKRKLRPRHMCMYIYRIYVFVYACACMYICICICIYIHNHIRIHTFIYACIHMYLYFFHMYVCIHASIYDLYQTQLSGCSAFPESRLQSLHPYSPLRANTFLRISRNRV